MPDSVIWENRGSTRGLIEWHWKSIFGRLGGVWPLNCKCVGKVCCSQLPCFVIYSPDIIIYQSMLTAFTGNGAELFPLEYLPVCAQECLMACVKYHIWSESCFALSFVRESCSC